MKIRHVGAEFFRAGGQTRMTKPSHLTQFCERGRNTSTKHKIYANHLTPYKLPTPDRLTQVHRSSAPPQHSGSIYQPVNWTRFLGTTA